MKNIEKWLTENSLEYSRNQYGNGTYFNDGFSVSGLQVAFYMDGVGNDRRKAAELERYMTRRKAYACRRERFSAGITYRIMTAFDAARLAEHERRVANAVEAFWQAEHARRTAKAAAI